MATILLEMLSRKGKFVAPEDVAAAVLTQGADETRRELVRLMAAAWGDTADSYFPGSWESCAWALEETARGLNP